VKSLVRYNKTLRVYTKANRIIWVIKNKRFLISFRYKSVLPQFILFAIFMNGLNKYRRLHACDTSGKSPFFFTSQKSQYTRCNICSINATVSPNFVERHKYTRWSASRGTSGRGKRVRMRLTPPCLFHLPFPPHCDEAQNRRYLAASTQN
jgi:hypothetical protein